MNRDSTLNKFAGCALRVCAALFIIAIGMNIGVWLGELIAGACG